MGWRSWNSFGNQITQDLIESQIEVLVARNRSVVGVPHPVSLADLGYDHCGIDEGWEACGKGVNGTQHRADGTPVIDTTKFPDLAKLVQSGHSANIKMGWYLNGCACGEKQEKLINYEGDVRSLSALDFDGVKIDSCGAQKNMTLYAELMNRTGKTFLVENCHQGQDFPDGGNPYIPPGADPHTTEWCPFNLFRTSGDISNFWDRVMGNLETTARFLSPLDSDFTAPLARPGCWAYPDMLEVGRLATAAEDQSHFGAWAISSSPLVLGLDLRDKAALDRIWSTITNLEALNVSQTWVVPDPTNQTPPAYPPVKGVSSSGGRVKSWRPVNLPTLTVDSGPCNTGGGTHGGFRKVGAALARGDDLHKGLYTLPEAEAFCGAHPECTGFTFQPQSPMVTSSPPTVYFKTVNHLLSPDPHWSSFLKRDLPYASNQTGFEFAPDGTLQVPNSTQTGSGLCLDSALQLPQVAAPNWIRVGACNTSSSTQQWTKAWVNGSSFHIRSTATGQCLAVAKHWLWDWAAMVSLAGCTNGSQAQLFRLGANGTVASADGQYCLGTSQFTGPKSQVWVKPLDLQTGRTAVLAINGAAVPHTLTVSFSDVINAPPPNSPASPPAKRQWQVWGVEDVGGGGANNAGGGAKEEGADGFTVRDVWGRSDLGVLSGNVSQKVEPHGSMFLVVTPL